MGKIFFSIINVFKKVGSFFKSVFGVISKVFGFFTKIPGLKNILRLAKGIPVIGWFITFITMIIDFFKGFINTEGDLFDKLAGGFSGIWNGLVDTIIGLPAKLVAWIIDKIGALFGFDIGTDWVDDYVNWFKDIGRSVFETVFGWARKVYDFFLGDDEKEAEPTEPGFFDKLIYFFTHFGEIIKDWILNIDVVKSALNVPLLGTMIRSALGLSEEEAEQIISGQNNKQTSEEKFMEDYKKRQELLKQAEMEAEEERRRRQEEYKATKGMESTLGNLSNKILPSKPGSEGNRYVNSVVNSLGEVTDFYRHVEIPDDIESLAIRLGSEAY